MNSFRTSSWGMAFFAVLVFVGLMSTLSPVLLSGMDHHVHCPFSPESGALCSTLLTHLGHWQLAFAAVFSELVVLAAVALVVLWLYHNDGLLRVHHYVRYRLRQQGLVRPPFLQELFAQGILNPKEPHYAL